MKMFGITILKICFLLRTGYQSKKCQGILSLSIYLLSIYQQLMYQHFQQFSKFFFPIDSFICCLWHADILSRRKTEQKLLPHNLRYFPSMESYFDRQLHQVDLTLYAQNNRKFLLNGSKIHCGFKLVYFTICHK